MRSSGGVGARRAALALVGVLLSLFVASAATAYADPGQVDREQEMPRAVRSTGVYLEPSSADGEPALWRRRLERRAAKADLGAPVKVLLWTPVKGVWPASRALYGDGSDTLRKLHLPPRSIALISDEPGLVLVRHGLESGPLSDRVDAWRAQAEAVVLRVERASPDPERYSTMSSVARAWIYLRLAAHDAPAPQALVEELSGDRSLLIDDATLPEPSSSGDGNAIFGSPWAIGTAILIVLGTMAWFLRQTWATRRGTLGQRAAASRSRTPDPLVESLTPLALEEDVTGLARQVAESDVRPGDAAYDRAQACLDAAAKYVDSDRERDRVGVHLLVAEGRATLHGEERRSKCFFNPLHTASTSVRRDKVTLPCCLRCAKEVSAGSEPGALLLTGDDGAVRPYYESDDVWTTTGYGAIDERWARRALLAALEER